MSRKRKTHNAKFKAKVALEAYKGDKTAAELISLHKISSGQISTWKKQLVTGAEQLFQPKRSKIMDEDKLTSPLYEEIGRLKVELDWLKKKSFEPIEQKRRWLDVKLKKMSIRRQCELLGLNRSSLYYQPKPESDEDINMMGMIDKIYTASPFYGSRRITAQLNRTHKIQ